MLLIVSEIILMIKMVRYKTVISDVGDIMLPTRRQLELEKKTLDYILRNNPVQGSAYELFRPYKKKGQTSLGMEDAIENFFGDHNINLCYPGYLEILKEFSDEEKPLSFFDGVTETLERLDGYDCDFYMVTDSSMDIDTLRKSTVELFQKQLKERNVSPDKELILTRYVKDILCSRTIGLKKDDEGYFPKLFSDYLPVDTGSVVFVGHEKEEIINASRNGVDVIALNWEDEDDASEIKDFIMSYDDKRMSRIYPVKNFTDIATVVKGDHSYG